MGAGDKKRILISGLRAKPQDAMRLASSRLDTPWASPKGREESLLLLEMAFPCHKWQHLRTFFGATFMGMSHFHHLLLFFPCSSFRFCFCFTFANCQCKAASDMKLFRFPSVFSLVPFFIFGKVEINFTVNAHNQVCVAMPPWTWQHDRVDGGSLAWSMQKTFTANGQKDEVLQCRLGGCGCGCCFLMKRQSWLQSQLEVEMS